MVKVYLKGFDRPISILGEPIFEDERFFVINNDGLRRKILWNNILYIEEFETKSNDKADVLKDLIREATQRKEKALVETKPLADLPSSQISWPLGAPGEAAHIGKDYSRVTQIDPEEKESFEDVDTMQVNVVFKGYVNESISILVSKSAMTGNYNASLARQIFSTKEVQSLMGGFIVSGVPKIIDNTIEFQTRPLQEIKDKLNMATTMLSGAAKAADSSISTRSPSMAIDPEFGLPGSPFEKLAHFSA